MSKKEKQIKKNLKMSAAFSEFVISHPEITKGMPNNVEIIFSDKNDPNLKRNNLRLTEDSRGIIYEAEKRGNNWRVARLTK